MLRDASYDGCKAGADQATASLDSMTGKGTALAAWQPSPYWDPETLRAIVTKGQTLLSSAYDALTNAANSCIQNIACPSGNISLLNSNRDQLNDATNQSQNYLAAIDSAESSLQGAVQTVYVQAPSVKVWVEDVIVYSQNAMHAAYVVACMDPWWAQAWSALVALANDYLAFVTSALGVAKDVAEAAIAAGQAAYTVAKESLGFLAWVTTHPWTVAGVLVAIAGGAIAFARRDQIRALVHRPRE